MSPYVTTPPYTVHRVALVFAPIWYKAANVYTIQPVYRGVVSLCALLREQLELARSRQLRRDRRLAHSRRATKQDQLPAAPAIRHVRPRQRALRNRGLKATCADA